jgi:diacylglycerol kinase family enzyme
MQQCNLANPSDGILDAIILPKMSIGQILTQAPRLLTGTVDKSDKIIYVRGRNFKVVPLDADSADIVELDGEIVGNLPVELQVLPKKINVLCNPKP